MSTYGSSVASMILIKWISLDCFCFAANIIKYETLKEYTTVDTLTLSEFTAY
jgi:hypothetical protein